MATTRTNHWKLGLFVVVSIVVVVVATFWLGAQRFERDSFQAVTYFDESVQGLEVGSPVKWRGVTIGTVAELTVAPDSRHVQVTSDIYVDALARLGLKRPQRGDTFIDPNLRVQLASAGITGVRFLQTDFFDAERHPLPELPFEPPWNYVPSTPSTLKSLEESVLDILNKFPDIEDGVNEAIADLRKTLASIDELAVWIPAEDGPVHELLAQVRSAAEKLERTIEEAKLGPTTASLRSASDEVGEAAARVGDLREELATSLTSLRETLDSVRALADSLERDPSVLIRGPRGDDGVPEGR